MELDAGTLAQSDTTSMDPDGYVAMPRGSGSGLEIGFDYDDDHAVKPPATLHLQRQKSSGPTDAQSGERSPRQLAEIPSTG